MPDNGEKWNLARETVGSGRLSVIMPVFNLEKEIEKNLLSTAELCRRLEFKTSCGLLHSLGQLLNKSFSFLCCHLLFRIPRFLSSALTEADVDHIVNRLYYGLWNYSVRLVVSGLLTSSSVSFINSRLH